MTLIWLHREVTGTKETKKDIVLFAGITEGRLLAEHLQELNQPFIACVTTRYVRDLPGDICRPNQVGYMEIHRGCLNVTEMGQMFNELWPGLIIDAIYPYAAEVIRNIGITCSGRKELRLIKCLREPGIGDSRPGAGVVRILEVGVAYMPGAETAATWLSSVTGNILVTTGSKELSLYIGARDYEQRIYARVLPSKEIVARCRSLGFEGRHIIAMQGPFSEEMDLIQLREYGRAHLVTRDDSAAGGFSEKIKAVCRTGAAVVVIDRPGNGEGISLDEIKGQLKEWMDYEKKGSIYE